MTPTPERALELADYLWSRLYAPAMITEEAIAQINEVLRHYADIATKWQAVLDAEPVAHKAECEGSWTVFVSAISAKYYIGERDGVITPLIIKPTP